jgi:ribonuclease Z
MSAAVSRSGSFSSACRWAVIDALLLTHYHSDHTVGIPDFWLTGCLYSHFARRTTPLRVIGPLGAKVLMSNLERAYGLDIQIRIADEKLAPEGAAIAVEEFAADGIVFDRNGVRVIAFEVDHGEVIKPAYGYRIEYGGRFVVLSGDTRYNENVIKYGTGADLLIHEVAIVRPELASEPYILRIMSHRTLIWSFSPAIIDPRHQRMTFLRRLDAVTPGRWWLGRT